MASADAVTPPSAAIGLRRRGAGPDDVPSATLEVAPPTVRTIGDPIDAKRRPDPGYLAQFSGPCAVAARLLGGNGPKLLAPALAGPARHLDH